MRPSATAMDQATSRVLNWRRPLATSSACTSKEVTYSRSPATVGVPQTSFDMRNRQGRQRPLSGAGPGLGTTADAEEEAGATAAPPGGRTQPVAESAEAACAAGAAALARGPGPIGTGEPPSSTGSPDGAGDAGLGGC